MRCATAEGTCSFVIATDKMQVSCP